MKTTEMQSKKQELERAISELVTKFAEETGLRVTDVTLGAMLWQSDDCLIHSIYEARVTAEL